MRTLFLILMAALLMACDGPIDAEPVAQAEPVVVAQAHPAAAAFGAWVTDGTTIMVSADGIGPIVDGIESLSAYTIAAQGDDFVELVTDDGTVYRVDLGDDRRMSSSALPNVSLRLN